jgi:tetratricopeptide (TPR) repeat protein
MKNIKYHYQKLEAQLTNLDLPMVDMPAHQRQLRDTLLASGHFKKDNVHLSARQKISGGIKMKSKMLVSWRLVASLLVVVLALGAYAAFFTAPQAAASLTLQVNPVITMTLDRENNVIDIKGLDSEGEALLAGLNVTGQEVSAALRTIAEAMRGAGFLALEQEIVLALHTIEDRLAEPALTALADTARQTLYGYLTEQGLPAEVKVAVVTAELVDTAQAIGLLPADYVGFVAEVGLPLAKEALKLQKELGLDPALFKEELDTIGEALLDMKEAGIVAEGAALAILQKALAADPKLEELTTITSAMVDLHEVGATQEDIMALFYLVEGKIAAGMDRSLALEEISTIVSAQIDLLEAGIPAAAALAAIKTAMAADPKLEELSTITDAIVDLTEKGLSKEEAMAKIQAAIKADPTLKNFDDLIEIPDKEDAKEERGEAAKRLKPEPKNAGSDKPEDDSSEKETDQDKARKGKNGKPEAEKPETEKDDAKKPEAQNIDKGSDQDKAKKAKNGNPGTGKPEAEKPDADTPDTGTEEEAGEKPDRPGPGAPKALPDGRNGGR